MGTDHFWPLCPLSPCSTSTLHCGRCKTGQWHSRRSSATPPTLGASAPTSSPNPHYDPSPAMSKGTRTERARMMAWEGTQSTQLPPHHHTPNTLLPTPCNHSTLLTNLILLNNFYHPPPWPWVQPLPLLVSHGQWLLPLPSPRCCPCPCLLTLRQERQQTERQ
jgi:hypothetical protein